MGGRNRQNLCSFTGLLTHRTMTESNFRVEHGLPFLAAKWRTLSGRQLWAWMLVVSRSPY